MITNYLKQAAELLLAHIQTSLFETSLLCGLILSTKSRLEVLNLTNSLVIFFHKKCDNSVKPQVFPSFP